MFAVALVAQPALADPSGLREQQRFDQIISGIGYRLAIGGSPLCDQSAPLAGFDLHDLSQYAGSEQNDARTTFGFTDLPQVLTLAPGSPAEGAGLRIDDAIVSIDGEPVAAPPAGARKSYARTAALLAQLDRAAADHRIELRIRRGTQLIDLSVAAPLGCPSRFQTAIGSRLESQADGVYVELTTGMIAFAGTEEQIAAVIAHEMAHNILRHRARLNAKGIRRGLLGQFGRSARLVRQTEIEADLLSVHLMARAGYDPGAIISFWERYRSAHPLEFLNSGTHPRAGDRIEIVRAEIARIASLNFPGQSHRPEFMMGATLPELR